jgi:hypothetical protein
MILFYFIIFESFQHLFFVDMLYNEEKKIPKMENKCSDIYHHHACSPFFGTQQMQKHI